MSTWPPECGNQLTNPYCLIDKPSDPYSWIYIDSLSRWIQAQIWTPGMASGINTAVLYLGNIYVCNIGSGNCTGLPTQGGYTQLDDTTESTQYAYDYCAYDFTGATPDVQTGSCEKSPLFGPGAECVNPCVRLANGKLAVNKKTSNCRVFPSTIGTSNFSVMANNCPTVCPSSCVEMWEQCPPGTAGLTTLLQTKNSDDLLSLTGPYKADGTLNPLWPSNYASKNSISMPPETSILGKPYTECYSYNTTFCDLPMAWQKTTGGLTTCYSSCPAGTFADPTNPQNCVFSPVDQSVYTADNFAANYTAATAVQRIFCNPQYFNPLYWGETGIQKGCTALPLPSKRGSTCPQGTSAVINEFFNLEWCLPDCSPGYTFDITQSTCVATCEGATSGLQSKSDFNQYLDYVDFYAVANRCKIFGGLELDCLQNNTPGRCPAFNYVPSESSERAFNIFTPVPDVRVGYNSVSKQTNVKLTRDLKNGHKTNWTLAKSEKMSNQLEGIKNHQLYKPKKKNVDYTFQDTMAQCPDGMAMGSTENNENPSFCYDLCYEQNGHGYLPDSMCANGSQDCAPNERIYVCRASCPSPEEGLGPWRELPPSDNLYTCAYAYPNGVPTNPNLWIQCPDDGRFIILQNTPTDLGLTAASASRIEGLCVRKTYLRQTTCPVGYNRSQDTCVTACDSNEMIVTLGDGTVVCQSTPVKSSRHEMDIIALADSHNSRDEFKSRILQRKSYVRGTGQDPNSGLGSDGLPEPWFGSIIKIGGVAIIGFVLFWLLKSFTSKK